jgi:hypothetical protein
MYKIMQQDIDDKLEVEGNLLGAALDQESLQAVYDKVFDRNNCNHDSAIIEPDAEQRRFEIGSILDYFAAKAMLQAAAGACKEYGVDPESIQLG